MKINVDSPEQEVRIELVPLIDVIFCILTFFILAAVTLTRQAALNINLPQASSGTPQMRQLLLVGVDRIGQSYVEKQPVTREQLYQALLQFQKTTPQGKIVLSADRYASYNDVVQVLDLLKSVGGDRVALATQATGATGDSLQFPTAPGSNQPTNPSSPYQLPIPSDSGNTPNSSIFPNLNSPVQPTQPQSPSGSNRSSLSSPKPTPGANSSPTGVP